jgi:2-dehydro-3-deoxyphosphogluconate aldolase / (4S)-4-hydroxy-2-oxoglutarate aldolase
MVRMTTALNEILRTRLVAIVRLDNYDRAVDVARALVTGGTTCIEFTLTGKGAFAAVGKVREALGARANVGLGTVLTGEHAREAIASGAQFLVTPIVTPDAIKAAVAADVPICCGAQTATEAYAAHQHGAGLIKIFPARSGGPAFIKDILAPLPFLKLVPTGGVSAQNARQFLDAGAVAVGIGGNLVSTSAVAAGDWASITRESAACAAATLP